MSTAEATSEERNQQDFTLRSFEASLDAEHAGVLQRFGSVAVNALRFYALGSEPMAVSDHFKKEKMNPYDVHFNDARG